MLKSVKEASSKSTGDGSSTRRASNHMTGAKSAFFELDSWIRKIVKFGDGSIVEIKGRDTILFVDKGGKHHKLTSVYFIPRLKANIVSLR